MLEGAGAASGGCRGLTLVPAWLWEGLTGTLRGDQLRVAFTSPGVRSFPGGGGGGGARSVRACRSPVMVNINEAVGARTTGRPGLPGRGEWR